MPHVDDSIDISKPFSYVGGAFAGTAGAASKGNANKASAATTFIFMELPPDKLFLMLTRKGFGGDSLIESFCRFSKLYERTGAAQFHHSEDVRKAGLLFSV